jgi:hypothetical protein
MRALFLTTAIALVSLAGAASAQSFNFEGAELSFTHTDSDYDYSGQHWRGSAEASVGSFGAQLDVSNFAYDGDIAYSSYGLHLNYRINDSIAAGVFYALDDWDGFEYAITGIEAQYDRNQMSVEAAVGNYSGLDGITYEMNFVSLDGSYDFGNGFSVLANAVSTNGDDEVGVVGLGVRYERSGAFVETTVSQFSGDFDQQVIGLEVGYAFGGGTTFESRDWNGLLGLY